MNRFKIILFLVLISLLKTLPAQQDPLDSLIKLAKTYTSNCNYSCIQDSNKVNLLDNISWKLKSVDLDSALIIANQALDIANKINWEKGIARAYTQLSICLRYMGKSEEALKASQTSLKLWDKMLEEDKNNVAWKTGKIKALYQISNNYSGKSDYVEAIRTGELCLALAEEIGDKRMMGGQIGNLGKIYEALGDVPKALDCYFRSLKIMEELGEKRSQAINYSAIGYIFINQKEYTKAIQYIQQGIDLSLEIGDKQAAGEFYGYMATVYENMKKFPLAIENALKALNIGIEISDKQTQSSNWRLLCALYTQTGQYTKALEAGNHAVENSKEMESPHYKANGLLELGNCYMQMKNYKEAETNLTEALNIGNQIKALDVAQRAQELLSALYTATSKFEKALLCYKNSILLRDSAFNEESNRKLIRTEMNFEFDKKTAVLKEQQEKEKLIAEEKSLIQKIIIGVVALVLVVVSFFTYMIFKALKITKKQKEIIELKEQETKKQNEMISFQKQLVEEKQKEILDSIHYARRIQNALITSENYIHKNLSRLNKDL